MQIKEQLLDIDGIKISSKPLLDLFIRRTAVLTSTHESISDKIIRDQWENANKQTQEGIATSEIDFPNIGTFFLSKNKAKNRISRNGIYINKLEKESLSTEDSRSQNRIRVRIERTQKETEDLKLKIKEEKTNEY